MRRIGLSIVSDLYFIRWASLDLFALFYRCWIHYMCIKLFKIPSNCPNKQSDSDPIPTFSFTNSPSQRMFTRVLVSTVTSIVSLSITSGQFRPTLKESQLKSTSIYGRMCKHPHWPHLFNTTTYKTTHHLFHVLIYLQFRSGRLCNHTRHPGAPKTCLNVLYM